MYTISDTDALAPIRSQRWAAFSQLLVPALKSHAPLFLVLGIHIVCAAVLTALNPGMTPPGLMTLALSFLAILGVILPLSILSLRFYHLATKVRPEHPIPALVRDMWDFLRQPDRAANGLSIVIVFIFFINIFTYLKGSVPIIQPFSWDPTFIE